MAELCDGCTSRCSGCPWAWCDEDEECYVEENVTSRLGGAVMSAASSAGSDGDGDDSCVMLGDDPAWLCSDDECIEGHIFLCASAAEPTLPGVRCELQTGLRKDGQPVWACVDETGDPWPEQRRPWPEARA